MNRKAKIATILMLSLSATLSGRAQHEGGDFPYPALPENVKEQQAQVDYTLTHFWNNFDFSDTTAVSRQTGEQGFVDFVNLMQYADSTVCAEAATAFVQRWTAPELPEKVSRWYIDLFDALTDHYLLNQRSPLRNDITLAHLLRALPSTPQRNYLLEMVERNQPGTLAADIQLTDKDGRQLQLYEVEAPLTLLVFYDPNCYECLDLLQRLDNNETLKQFSSTMKTFLIQPDEEMQRQQTYFLPSLPALYLLDSNKHVLLKNATLEQVMERLNIEH